jgi:hypothetical protein
MNRSSNNLPVLELKVVVQWLHRVAVSWLGEWLASEWHSFQKMFGQSIVL